MNSLPQQPPLPFGFGGFVLLLAIVCGSVVLAGAIMVLLPADAGFAAQVLAMLVQAAAMMFGIYLLAVRRHRISWRRLGFGRPDSKWIARGILGGLAGLILASLYGIFLELVLGYVPENPQIRMLMPQTFSWLAAIAMMAMTAVVVPVAEEAIFRGLVYRWLRERMGLRGGLVLSSVLFGILHFIPFLAPVLAILGAIFAWLYERSGSLWPPIIAHAVFNGLTTLMLYANLAINNHA